MKRFLSCFMLILLHTSFAFAGSDVFSNRVFLDNYQITEKATEFYVLKKEIIGKNVIKRGEFEDPREYAKREKLLVENRLEKVVSELKNVKIMVPADTNRGKIWRLGKYKYNANSGGRVDPWQYFPLYLDFELLHRWLSAHKYTKVFTGRYYPKSVFLDNDSCKIRTTQIVNAMYNSREEEEPWFFDYIRYFAGRDGRPDRRLFYQKHYERVYRSTRSRSWKGHRTEYDYIDCLFDYCYAGDCPYMPLFCSPERGRKIRVNEYALSFEIALSLPENQTLKNHRVYFNLDGFRIRLGSEILFVTDNDQWANWDGLK